MFYLLAGGGHAWLPPFFLSKRCIKWLGGIQLNELEIVDRREHYFKVSNHIFNQELNVYEIGVYSCLCRFADNDSTESFPSITKIQKMLNVSRPKVVSSIKSLVEKKIIFKKMGHTGKSNRYYLLNLPSKQQLLVNDINQGSKPHLPTSKPRLPEVVNEVNSIKTYSKKTNKKDLGKKALFLEWNKCLEAATKGTNGYKSLNELTKVALQKACGFTALRTADSFNREKMKYAFVDAYEECLKAH
jgi:DNA-binding MarR family transcriptional regulator